MFLLQIELSQLQAGIIFGAALGAILGIVPLALGVIKKKLKYGILGFVGAIFGNALLGLLLSIPIIALCLYVILRKDASAITSEANRGANISL